jgi:nicotinamidase-related amidase
MTAEEVKELQPLAEVYELDKMHRYLICIPTELTKIQVNTLSDTLSRNGIHGVVLCGMPKELQIFDIKADHT